jgi:hypothetical protein
MVDMYKCFVGTCLSIHPVALKAIINNPISLDTDVK